MTDTADAERRHEGPSYWVGSSLADLELCAAEFRPDPDDAWGNQILGHLRSEIVRRQHAIAEARSNASAAQWRDLLDKINDGGIGAALTDRRELFTALGLGVEADRAGEAIGWLEQAIHDALDRFPEIREELWW